MRQLATITIASVPLVGCSMLAGGCGAQGVEDWFGSTGRYETVEEAFESVTVVPGTPPLHEYARVDTGSGRVDFVHRVAGTEHHRWELVRDDGDWLVWARSGCLPSTRP